MAIKSYTAKKTKQQQQQKRTITKTRALKRDSEIVYELYFLNSFRFKSCLRRVGDSRCEGSMTMLQAGNNAKYFSSVNHTTKAIHHHHHHHHHYHHQEEIHMIHVKEFIFKWTCRNETCNFTRNELLDKEFLPGLLWF